MSTDAERLTRFEHLWEHSFPRVLGYALRRSEPEEARDVAAETFLIAWRRLDDVPVEDDALPWLLVTARRVLANRRRANGRAATILPLLETDLNAAAVSDPADTVAERAALAAAFGRLDGTDQETLAMTAWDGLAPREAAMVAGCSAATFAVRAHRARRRLVSFLAEEEASELGTPRRSS